LASGKTGVFARCAALGLSVLAFAGRSAAGLADELSFGPHDVRSVFYVSKSENYNQVHYALRLDASCRPRSNRPVWAYWKRVKEGRRWDAPLSRPARHVYGVGDEQRVRRSESGGQVQVYVRALEQLRIEIDVRSKGTVGCEAGATTTIAGKRARLSHAYLKIRPLRPRPEYVEVIGYRDGRRVRERYH
jgi:hypothetical protein